MTANRGPTKRLLITPALVLGTVLAAVVVTGSAVPRPAEDAREVVGLAPVTSSPVPVCRREREGTAPVLPAVPSGGGRVTSGQVVGCPAAFDGQQVTYAGEVVGDLLHRDGGAWVLVNDDDYALEVGPLPGHRDHRGTNAGLSVWLPDHLLDRITGLGRPDQRGDVIQIDGRIVRTDPADGGGLTLRADDFDILQPAQRFEEPLHRPQVVLAAVSLLAAVVLTGLRRRGRA